MTNTLTDDTDGDPTGTDSRATSRTPGAGPRDPGRGSSTFARDAAPSAADELERRFGWFILVGRWAIIAIGIFLATRRDGLTALDLTAALILTIWAVFASVRRFPFGDRDPRWWAAVAIETVVALLAAAGTGGADSPWVLAPVIPIALVGFTLGRRDVVALVVVGATTLASAALFQLSEPQSEQSSTLLAMLLFLGGVIGAFARRLIEETRAREGVTRDELTRLETANELLRALHGVARSLPASFDVAEIVDSLAARLRERFDPSVIVLLLADGAVSDWRVELAHGVRLATHLSSSELTPAARDAIGTVRAIRVSDSLAEGGPMLSPFARSGLYVSLHSHERIVGLLAVEQDTPRRFDSADAAWLEEIGGPLAIALDNARWFARLRGSAADAERARIARDLHDRLAQSLAYVRFELERMAERGASTEELTALMTVVSEVVTNLRETLVDLRTRVTDNESFGAVASRFFERVEARSGLTIDFTDAATRRLATPVEQELWLLCQEAVLNAERHSGATQVDVTWSTTPACTRLEIRDNGVGFETEEQAGDRYGLVGMRERADAIGARLGLHSSPASGTTVLVELDGEHRDR